MNPKASANGWALEVVRGKSVGRTYPLNGGGLVLGNNPGEARGIDLSEQEGPSPRRMAARQAMLEWANGEPALRDLDSPGGTFVNRQRLPSGQARPLREGDVIQLGGVQLRLVGRPGAARPPAPPPPPRAPSPAMGRGPFAYQLPSGATCRSWDDFLTISAQKWDELRDELTSGRLASHLINAGRADFAPAPGAPGSADERLDAWIASLPTTKPSLPEVEVHPNRLEVRAAPGGGATRRKVRVANAGYRLLRGTARIEPKGTSWLRLATGIGTGSFVTVEGLDLALDLTIPESLVGDVSATLVLETNGGTARVEVALLPPAPKDGIPDSPADSVSVPAWDLREAIAPIPTRWRVMISAMALGGLRLAVGMVGMASGLSGLAAGAALLASLGGLGGAWLALRRGGPSDLPSGGFAGAFGGVLAAAAFFASCRSIEPLLGEALSSWLLAVAMLWAGLGAALGMGSSWWAPPRTVE